MALTNAITFVVAVSNKEIYENNFLASPLLRGNHGHQLLEQVNFPSAARAYNEAIDRAANDLIVFAHQDVFFPDPWLSQLQNALAYLEGVDPNWGVIGCAGITRNGELWSHVYSSGWGVIGKPFEHPMAVQTLDEIVLILRKSAGLRFDARLPHFHLYGADICLAAAERGLKSYAISAFCIHNTEQIFVLPEEFYECCNYIKRTWKDYLPIQTTCIRISRLDLDRRVRRLKEFRLRLFRAQEKRARRAGDPQQILEQLQVEGKLQLCEARTRTA